MNQSAWISAVKWNDQRQGMYLYASSIMKMMSFGLWTWRWCRLPKIWARMIFEWPRSNKKHPVVSAQWRGPYFFRIHVYLSTCRKKAWNWAKHLARIFHEFAQISRRILVPQGNLWRSPVSVITGDWRNIACGIKRQARLCIIDEISGLGYCLPRSSCLAFLWCQLNSYKNINWGKIKWT